MNQKHFKKGFQNNNNNSKIKFYKDYKNSKNIMMIKGIKINKMFNLNQIYQLLFLIPSKIFKTIIPKNCKNQQKNKINSI